MKLTVLSVAYPFAPVGPDAAGGSEQILSLLDRTLYRAGHRSVVVAREGSVVAGTLVATPAAPGWLEDGSVVARENHRKAILRALSGWRFDLIHMHSLDFYTYMPPPGAPVLVTLHLPPDWYPEHVFSIERPNTWLQCVSASQRRSCPPSRALLPPIENGVPVEKLKTTVRKRNFALCLGRVCPEKGFHLALDAAKKADYPLLIAGELFRYRDHEAYFSRELLPRLEAGFRRFLGPVGFTRKTRLLAAARCLLAPSLVPETSSLVAMEAMASGTPVIAYPAGALADIVEHGKTGFLVDNVNDMAWAIRMAGAIDPENCRRAAQRRFNASRMIREYLDLYHELAAPGFPTYEHVPGVQGWMREARDYSKS